MMISSEAAYERIVQSCKNRVMKEITGACDREVFVVEVDDIPDRCYRDIIDYLVDLCYKVDSFPGCYEGSDWCLKIRW